MEYKEKSEGNEYFKVILVRVKADEYVILKGPEEEKRLAGVLRNDYNSTRYEKMLQLLAVEVVQKEYQEGFLLVFSMENIIKELKEGRTRIGYSYIREICGRQEMVEARVYPRMERGGELEEFMVYVVCHEEGCRCGIESAEGSGELS